MSKKFSFAIAFLLVTIALPFCSYGQQLNITNLHDLEESPQDFVHVFTMDEVEEIQTLVYDLNPTIFISNSGINKFGDGAAVIAEVSAGSLQKLRASNSDFASVKLLKVKIEEASDLNFSLDLALLKGFKNLKYVYVQCSTNCNPNQIQNRFSNTENVKLLYIIATPR